MERIVESLYDRILGRVSVHDVIHPKRQVLVYSGDEINEDSASAIESPPIEMVEIAGNVRIETRSLL